MAWSASLETPDVNPATSNPGVQYVLALQGYYFCNS